MKKREHKQLIQPSAAVRYWLFWTLFIAALAVGFYCYLEHRNMELDKRIERLNY